MITPRLALAPLSLALALGATGCSVLFAPGNWSGNEGVDAGVEAIDAPIEPNTDAYVGPGVDAPVGDDAFTPTPCSDESMCALDEYCDGTSRTCVSCDGDGDGLPARECAGSLFFDCDLTTAPVPTTVVLADSDFVDTLRAFRAGGRTHLFWRNASGAMRLALGMDTLGRRLEYSSGFATPRRVTAFDAVRTRDGIVVAGYDAEFLYRFDLGEAGIQDTANRPLAGAVDSGFLMLTPQGAPTIIRADATTTFLGFPASYSDMGGTTYGGRVVLGIGNPHIARFHATGPSPDDFRTASGNGVAVIPHDVGDGRSVYLWNGDLSPDDGPRTPLLAVPETPSSAVLGQVAIAVGDGERGSPSALNVIVALAETTGGVRVELLRCPMDASMPCTREPGRDYRIADTEAGVVAMIAPPSSGTAGILLRSYPDQFLVDMIDLEGAGGTFAVPPEPEPLLDIPVPTLDDPARALSIDLALDLRVLPPRATLVLARAARRQIQTIALEVCLAPP